MSDPGHNPISSEPPLLGGSLVYASDTHIRHMGDERGKLLLDLIERIDVNRTEYFVLNGDLFDFCFGGSPYFRKKFSQLGSALTDLSKKGVKVVVVEGNHEFRLDLIGWKEITIVTEKNFLASLKDGTQIKISHGDQIKYDFWYKLYRGIAKSWLFALLAKLVPGKLVDRLCLDHADQSRKRGESRTLDHKALLESANIWLDESPANHGIFGHFHTPYGEHRKNQSGMIVCVESWDRPNALIFDDGKFQRCYLAAVGRPFKKVPVQSYFS